MKKNTKDNLMITGVVVGLLLVLLSIAWGVIYLLLFIILFAFHQLGFFHGFGYGDLIWISIALLPLAVLLKFLFSPNITVRKG